MTLEQLFNKLRFDLFLPTATATGVLNMPLVERMDDQPGGFVCNAILTGQARAGLLYHGSC